MDSSGSYLTIFDFKGGLCYLSLDKALSTTKPIVKRAIRWFHLFPYEIPIVKTLLPELCELKPPLRIPPRIGAVS